MSEYDECSVIVCLEKIMKQISVIICCIFAYIWPYSAYAESFDDKLNGLWFKGSCEAPDFIYYYLNGFYHIMSPTYARLVRPTPSRKTNKSIIEQWENKRKEKPFLIEYAWLEKGRQIRASKRYATKPDIAKLPDRPPSDYVISTRKKCNTFPSNLSFLHLEALSFIKSMNNLPKSCEGRGYDCVKYIFSTVEVIKDGKLSRAELSRLIRILSYFSVISGNGARNDKISGSAALASIFGPFIASSIIAGSDYDDDGKLSLEELLIDKDPENIAATFERLSFDVAVEILTKIFSGMGRLLSLF